MHAVEPTPIPPPPPVIEHCYRHPDVETGVHCTRCGRPICTDCMYPAAVGYRCPECVKEAKQEFIRPAQRIGTVGRGWTLTNLILLSLVGVYVLEVAAAGAGDLVAGPSVSTLVRLGANVGLWPPPAAFATEGVAFGQFWRLFTAMFLHAGLLHIALNGYALWIVGNVVETEIGRLRFLALYLACGLFASAASYAFGAILIPGVGASGAIFGLFGAFFAYNYSRRQLAFYAARMRQMGMLILLNLVLSFGFSSVIDWRAHLGGLVAGLAGGLAVDGFGRRSIRVPIFATTIAVILVVAVGLTVWRTGDIRGQFPQLFG
jgi:membrane associated rhomboid family serine protease